MQKTKINFFKTIVLILGIIQINNTFAQTPCKEVIGYYPGWQWYDRSKLVNPETIQYEKYTIINYAFLYPLEDGTITITDPWGDKNLLLGAINWAVAPAGYDSNYDLGNPAYHHPGTSIVYHAHASGVPVLISLGGWTLSDDFSGIAANPVKRSNFAHWCNELIRVYNIDGIDIDWEYPGFADHGGTPADKENFTLLLQEVRDSLDALEPIVGKNLMLTAAVSGDPSKMEDVEWDNVTEILDYINLMSYDFFGAFSSETNHNAPLYAPESGDPNFNCDAAIQRLINVYNVPSTKLNMGVAFYGRTAITPGTAALHIPHTGAADLGTFSVDDGTPMYYNILIQQDNFDYHWDDTAKVPYLTGKDGLNSFVSYDDERSIGLKGQYIVDNELAGAIIWEITGDYVETIPGSGIIGSTPLTDTLNLALCNPPSDGSGPGDGDDGPFASSYESDVNTITFPNPATTTIYLKGNHNAYSEYTIYQLNGKRIKNAPLQTTSIDITDLTPGVYFLELTTDNQEKFIVKFIKK